MTPQMQQLYLALKDLYDALEESLDVDTRSINLTSQVVSAFQQARTVVKKYEGAAE